MVIMSRKRFVLILVSVVLAAAIVFGGGTWALASLTGADLRLGGQAPSKDLASDFRQVADILMKEYYVPVDADKLLEGAIGGLANSLDDPYTQYFTKAQMEAFTEETQGSYSGIGISFHADADGYFVVVEVFDGSPAKEA